MAKYNKKLNNNILENILLAAKDNKLERVKIYPSKANRNKGTLMVEHSINKDRIENNITDYPSLIRAIDKIKYHFNKNDIDSVDLDFYCKKNTFLFRIILKG